MHKRFERDGERLKKKFVTLSKRSVSQGGDGVEITNASAIVPFGTSRNTNAVTSIVIEEAEGEDGV